MLRCSNAARWLIALMVLVVPVMGLADDDSSVTSKAASFREQVYPLLASRCLDCHAGRESSSGYRLDDRAELLGETQGTPLVKIGQSEQSLLIERVAAEDPDLRMPPEGEPLTAAEIGLLQAWIDQGLDWDDSLLPPADDGLEHWAFQPVVRPPVPEAQRCRWVRNPVDAFIAAGHERQGLAPAEPASRRTLIRRLSLDLRGFPPTPAEVDALLDDARPTAYAMLVERYLASPHYGERWGRHWLDVARWAESEGYSPVTSPHSVEVLPDQGFYPLPYDPAELASRKPYLQVRGDVHQIGPTVQTGWPAVFDSIRARSPPPQKPLTRLDLADWLTDPEHPLTARVWVNRIWHYHFGRGIVATPGDFGLQGAAPSHPELLDWLAAEFIDKGWSTKHIHRLILNSSTYRQSSLVKQPQFQQSDPENAFVWHWRPRRLEAEAIRDCLLAVTGELDWTVGGASVARDQFAETRRRSLYLFQRRGAPPEIQSLFDGPREVAESCPRRHASTTALQSLYLLNHPFVQQQAGTLAERIALEAGTDRDKRIETAFLLALGRPADEAERVAARDFLESYPAEKSATAIVHFCHALLNLNEFVYVE